MHYPDLNPLCLFKLHDNYPETGGFTKKLNKKIQSGGLEKREAGVAFLLSN